MTGAKNMETIETERLILRPFNEDDFNAVHSYASNPENVIYMMWGPNTPAETQAFINLAIKKAAEEPCRNYQYAAVQKYNNRLIGACNLSLYGPAEAEAGWILHQDCWKQGFGTEMGRRLLILAFDVLKLHRVVARCDAENYGSRKVMENIGMRREGLFLEGRPANKCFGKEYGDEYAYAILKSEWDAAQKLETFISVK
jgi:RimJ/RimL family protein N-acetyltransferase